MPFFPEGSKSIVNDIFCHVILLDEFKNKIVQLREILVVDNFKSNIIARYYFFYKLCFSFGHFKKNSETNLAKIA